MRELLCAVALLTTVTGSSVEAGSPCVEPVEPFCVRFFDASNFDLCRYQVKRYLTEAEIYIQCVTQNTEDSSKAVVKRFNCYAAGNEYCY